MQLCFFPVVVCVCVLSFQVDLLVFISQKTFGLHIYSFLWVWLLWLVCGQSCPCKTRHEENL